MLAFKYQDQKYSIERAPESKGASFSLPELTQADLARKIEECKPARIEFCGYAKAELESVLARDQRPRYALFRFDGIEIKLHMRRKNNRFYSGRSRF